MAEPGKDTRYRVVLGVGVGALVLDQLTKLWVMASLPYYGAVTVIPGFFDLVNIRNRGAAFGFLNRSDIEWQFWLFFAATLVSAGVIFMLARSAHRGEKLLFKISTGMVLTKLLVVAALGVSMVGMWHLYNIGALPPMALLVKNAIITLPFTLTSILFIQTLSPMVISYRSREKSVEVARHKALRAMNIAFGILFVTVFFYAVSFTLAMGHDEAVKAYEQNISALAIAAQFISGAGAGWVKVVSVILNIFAVMTAFFGVYLGFREATQGIAMNILRRKLPAEKINETLVQRGIMVFAILLAWSAIVLNAPVLSFTSICSPIFGMVGCLIPAWLVYKVPALHKYKGVSLYLIIVTGLLLCVSPFLAFS